MPTTIQDDFNEIVQAINEFGYKFNVYYSDWATLPPAVKTTIKQRAQEILITQGIPLIQALNNRIQSA